MLFCHLKRFSKACIYVSVKKKIALWAAYYLATCLFYLHYYEYLSMLAFIDLYGIPLKGYRIEQFVSSPIMDILVAYYSLPYHIQYLNEYPCVYIWYCIYIHIHLIGPLFGCFLGLVLKCKWVYIITSLIYKIFCEYKVRVGLLIHGMLFHIIKIIGLITS